MTRRETKRNARRCVPFVIIFRAFISDFTVTVILLLIPAGYSPNEQFIFCTFTVSGKITVIISLAVAVVIRMASTLLIIVRDLLTFTATDSSPRSNECYYDSISNIVFNCSPHYLTYPTVLSHEMFTIFHFMPWLFAIVTCKGHSGFAQIITQF